MMLLDPADWLSRRSFVVYGAGLLACAPVSAKPQSLASTDVPSAEQGTQDARRVAAATDIAQHLTINVEINGRGPFRFVVDTGADRTVISEDVARSLNLAVVKQVMVEGIVRTIPAKSVTLDTIAFGSISCSRLSVPMLSQPLLAADGYLGLDVIDGHRVTFDFANLSLKVGESGSHILPYGVFPNESRVPVYGSAGHLRATNCKVDGVTSTAFIDSGAQVSIGNSKLLEALIATNSDFHLGEKVPITGVTGGTAEGRVIRIKRAAMHSLRFFDGLIVIADLQIFDLWGLSGTPALLIGMNFLRKFSQVTIDYGLKELRFELANVAMARRA